MRSPERLTNGRSASAFGDMIGCEAKPFAFVSSFTAEHEELRRRLSAVGQESGRYVWVAEVANPALSPRGKAPMEIVDTLLDRVREAELFVAVLGGSRRGENEHGTAIRFYGEATSVSHFEAELFYAAALGKRVQLYVRRGFDPGPRLRALLKILEFAFPDHEWRTPMSDDEIVRDFARVVTWRPLFLAGRSRPSLRGRFVAAFFSAPDRNRELLWLGGSYERRTALPDKDRIITVLLPEIERITDHERKLARTWIILRELMAVPPDDSRVTLRNEFLPLWNRALGLWSGTAAWMGLHGHIHLGGLAGLNSVAQVRARLREVSTSSGAARELAHPATALASAHYSIAKLAPIRRQRDALFAHARNELGRADTSNPAIGSNVHAISGSIHLQQWAVSSAVADFEAALALRQRHEPHDSQRIGESLSELGFAHVFGFRPWHGVQLMEEGVRLMESHGPTGFLARGLEKLARGYAVTGRLIAAHATWQRSRQLSLQGRLLGRI